MVRDLRPDQLATVDLAGEVLEGALGPENAEIIAMHSVIYRTRGDVGAVIRTHSPAATAFALAHRPLPSRTSRPRRAWWCRSCDVVFDGHELEVDTAVMVGGEDGPGTVYALRCAHCGAAGTWLVNHPGQKNSS